MFKKLRWAMLIFLASFTLLMPGAALAKRHHEYREHRAHVQVSIGVGPRYHHRYYRTGYYDRWGYWHPYRHYRGGYYDRWGYWHPYR